MKSNIETKVTAANESIEAKTLRELGMDGALARELEQAFRLLGHVKGDRVEGFTFSTPDGQRHTLRVERPRNELARAA